MLSKIAILMFVVLAVWALFFRARRRPPPVDGNRPRLPSPLHLAKCARCGVYRLPGAPCDCTRRGSDS